MSRRPKFQDVMSVIERRIRQGDYVLNPIPGERIVQTADFESDDPAYAGTMTMTWELRPVPDGTEVTIIASDVPPGISAEDHAQGLASTLSNLADFLE